MAVQSEKAPVTPSAGTLTAPPALPHESQGLTMLRMVVATARTLAHADAVAILLYERERHIFIPTTPRAAAGPDERWLQSHGLAAALLWIAVVGGGYSIPLVSELVCCHAAALNRRQGRLAAIGSERHACVAHWSLPEQEVRPAPR